MAKCGPSLGLRSARCPEITSGIGASPNMLRRTFRTPRATPAALTIGNAGPATRRKVNQSPEKTDVALVGSRPDGREP